MLEFPVWVCAPAVDFDAAAARFLQRRARARSLARSFTCVGTVGFLKLLDGAPSTSCESDVPNPPRNAALDPD